MGYAPPWQTPPSRSAGCQARKAPRRFQPDMPDGRSGRERKKEAAMLSRIHVYAASLGLLLAGPAIATGQSSSGVMPDRASVAVVPSYEVMGFPITPHQFSVVGSAHVEEQSP